MRKGITNLHKTLEKDTYIRQLFQNFLENRHSDAELEELLSFFELDTKDSVIYPEEVDRIGARVTLKLAKELAPIPAVHRIADRRPWKISPRLAATAVVLTFASITFFVLKTGIMAGTEPAAWSIDEPIATGNGATLLLGDGRQLDLDESQHGIVVPMELPTWMERHWSAQTKYPKSG